jgi:signal transduction histidine kinase
LLVKGTTMRASESHSARWADRKGGLGRRIVFASVLLLLVTVGAFTILILADNGLRGAVDLRRESREVIVTANHLERLVVDLETSQRGFIIAGQERFLRPWNEARAAIPEQTATLERQAAAVNPVQAERARQIKQSLDAYIRDYAIPTVEAARRDPAFVRTVAVTDEGMRRLDAIRDQFDGFVASQRKILSVDADRASAAARHARVAAATGVTGSIVLILLFAAYQIRSVVQPVHRAAGMACTLAAGDLSVRMPETGPGEIGALQQAFNTMASSLQTSRGELCRTADELRRIAQEQAALQRVATIVARSPLPTEVFSAVAAEMGRIVGADSTSIERCEPDGTVTVVGSWSKSGAPQLFTTGSRLPVEDGSVSALVLQSGQPFRATSVKDVPSEGEVVGSAVVVEGRLWGVVIAFSADPEPLPEGTEGHMFEFTELVATAIANTESRAELTASRARVVAAADASRRRVERDLHDGAQQRLVSLGLELRETEAALPSELSQVKEQLSHAASGLTGVLEELQELSRGLHPAILSKGGLAPAIRTLGRRSAIPVELDLNIDRRLADQVEVAAYYIVSEALTNAAKHSHASVVKVRANVEDTDLRIAVRDDGIGGADPRQGSGLIGLVDRIEAIGGILCIDSPMGKGTSLLATIPITTKRPDAVPAFDVI